LIANAPNLFAESSPKIEGEADAAIMNTSKEK
jgi:hypothetical protein